VTKPKATGKRKTGDRVSRVAARVLRLIQDGAFFEWYEPSRNEYREGTHLVKALAAFCLAHDEFRGSRKRVKGKRKP
jgi:hypothetical protein